jgi:Fe-S-cluster-containing hydrogenase component 2
MLDKTGVASKDLVLSRYFDEKVLARPKAILECYEDIPCNPCSTSCPFDAIIIGDNINTQPKLIPDKCTGCGICVTSCPGLAIIVAQIKFDQAVFKIPYEFNPKPQVGDIVDGINRSGEKICDAKILKVNLSNKFDHTALIEVSVPIEYLHDFVTVRV